jgi:hypothetical protein
MSDKLLRKELIKLAHTTPELRPHLLPIIKSAADDDAEMEPEEKDEKAAKKAGDEEKEEEEKPEETEASKKAARLAALRQHRQAGDEQKKVPDEEPEKTEETEASKKAARLAALRQQRQAAERMLAKMLGELWSTADGSLSLKMAMRSGTGTAYFKKLMMAYNQRKLNITFDDTTLTFTIQKGPEDPTAVV